MLVSGGHGRLDYDEVNAMRRELVRRGVPDGDVFTDHAGFDTWSTMVRARKVYGLEGRKSKVREVLARVKAVEDVVTGAKPRLLGPKVPITGSAQASRG